MSNFDHNEGNREEPRDISPSSPHRTKCRIPQALSSIRPRTQVNKPVNQQVTVVQNVRVPRTPQPRSKSRSRSAARSDTLSVKQGHMLRPTRPENITVPPRKLPVYRKSPIANKFGGGLRNQNNQKFPKPHQLLQGKLPDQETIKKREELELQGASSFQDEIDLSDAVIVKSSWIKKISQFEKMKHELEVQQKKIMELYATLRNAHKTMAALGQNVNMPSADDLRIMNVAKLTPDQLLQLCAGTRLQEENTTMQTCSATIDMSKLYDMPTKLVATCEQTLLKRKEIIDWFQALKAEEKGISMNKLTKKINEFNAENEMLSSSLNTCKTDFLKELNEIVDYLRKGVNETIALQLRTEELMYEVSELNAQNIDLRKQLQSTEHLKSIHNKHKLEELDKELKEEKCKRVLMKDRLTRAEGQVKIGNERAMQLESALELARSQNWTLERTIQQLNEQNQKLQSDFDVELSKLTDSIKTNTVNLQDIAEAREKLQAEKEDLEKRLQELTVSYKDSLDKINKELNDNTKKLKETEKMFESESQERKKLESKLESLCAQLLETELRYKETLKKMQEQEDEISKGVIVKCELEATKQSLAAANKELDDCKNRLVRQGETIQEIERNFQETIVLERSLRADLRAKEKYIAELEKNRSLLEQQIHEGEHKIESYDKQLNALKSQIEQVQEEFGEFDNLSQLQEMINEQRDKLLETTRQNGELANALQQKELELEVQLEHLAEEEQLLEQKDGVIKMLTEKEEEQANIIKLLRNNLEMRAQADADLTQQLADKNSEINSLVSNIETRKQQVSQLEKIILTLEEQLRKVHLLRRRDHDKMTMLEKAITDYETFPVDIKRSIETPVENLDNLIKILEDELGTSFELKPAEKHPIKKKTPGERKKLDKVEHYAEGKIDDSPYSVVENVTIKSPQLNMKQSISNLERDNLDRKKAITNIDTQKWQPCQEPIRVYTSCVEKNNLQPFRGMVPVVQVMGSQRDDKKGKMFKFAGHKL